MEPWLIFAGNSHSLHSEGRAAHDAVENARAMIAEAIGAEAPEQIIFTASATEANNLVLHSFSQVSVSPFEHSSVREAAIGRGACTLKNDGWNLGLIEQNGLVSVIGVSNETGGEPEFELQRGLLHRDHSQTIRSRPFHLKNEDFATFSGHKMGGPLGAACLFVADPTLLHPQQMGGGHEYGLRPGTANVAAIVGLARAFSLPRSFAAIADLRLQLKADLAELGCIWIEAPQQSEGIAAITFGDVLAEALVLELDAHGYATSAGAACSSGSGLPSPTLTALAYSAEAARSTLRISFGPGQTTKSTKQLAEALVNAVKSLRNRSRI